MLRAVVLLSGGVDSATTLAIAREEGYACSALSFDYGQRHRAELEAAARVATQLGARAHQIYSLSPVLFGGSALTDPAIPVPEPDLDPMLKTPEGGASRDIPVTYVPARNLVFLSLALAWAETLKTHDIFIGANAVDYSGYPDCRREFLLAFQTAANLATRAGVGGADIRIHSPLLDWSKREIIQRGAALGVDYALTVSCYSATPGGRACGRCESCQLRARGFSDAGVPDPTRYV